MLDPLSSYEFENNYRQHAAQFRQQLYDMPPSYYPVTSQADEAEAQRKQRIIEEQLRIAKDNQQKNVPRQLRSEKEAQKLVSQLLQKGKEIEIRKDMVKNQLEVTADFRGGSSARGSRDIDPRE